LLTERKTDQFDVLNIPTDYNFHFKVFSGFFGFLHRHDITEILLKVELNTINHFKNRKKCINKSGGIVVIFKKKMSLKMKFVDFDSNFVQWIEISKKIL
jgi:hypothetical protein